MRCHYEVLGVEQTIDEAGLKKAYRVAALQWHPGELRRHNYVDSLPNDIKRGAYFLCMRPCRQESKPDRGGR